MFSIQCLLSMINNYNPYSELVFSKSVTVSLSRKKNYVYYLCGYVSNDGIHVL